MAKLTSPDGSITIESDVPREIVRLQAEGYRLEKPKAAQNKKRTTEPS